jgi:malonate transporter and related proteins
MSAVLATILPVFGLIAIGFAAGRSGYVSAAAAKGLPEFMFKVAMPALLFRTLGTATLPDVAPAGICLAYFGASATTWLLSTILVRFLLRRPATDAPSISFAASFSNAVMMGIPLCLSYFGERSAPVLALIVALDVALLWSAAAFQFAWAQGSHVTPAGDDPEGRTRTSTARVFGDVVWRLITNPIILACAAGLAWNQIGSTGLSRYWRSQAFPARCARWG